MSSAATQHRCCASGEASGKAARQVLGTYSLLEQKPTAEALKKISERLAKQAMAHALPADLDDQVRARLAECPELSWDQALAQVLGVG